MVPPTTNGAQANGATDDIPQPRLLAKVVSDYAQDDPQKIWGSLPKSASDASKGYEDITFRRLNYAISRAATWLQDTHQDSKSRDFEALAYLGPPDSRYVIFAIAAIKAGFQVLFLSPRNSDEAQYSVLEQADCQKFLCALPMKKRVEALINGRSDLSKLVQITTVPEQEDLLKDEFVPEFPYEKTVEQAGREPLVTLHTSSTTGMPKTIHLNQGWGFHEDVLQHIPPYNGLDIITRKPFYGHCRMFVAMPLFHAGGVILTLLKSLYHDIVAVFQPPAVPLNAEVFDAILRFGKCSGCVIPPSLLEDMVTVPAFFDTLASLDFVQFGSGPLSKVTGDTLITRQKDCPHYIGSSECGIYPLLELDDPTRDWQYFRFHPWSGADFRPVDGDESLRELVITRVENKTPGLQPVFELFPELDEWPTRDLYVQHPNRPDHWRCIGRNDDVMVLSNGEKLNPTETEGRIANTHPAVSGALVIGQGRFMPGLLLETRGVDARDPKERAQLIEELWPTVERANLEAPKHGQLIKSLILFTSPEKPFARTPKLSVRRGPTIELYAKEIAEMYHRFESDLDSSGDVEIPVDVDMSSVDGLRDVLSGMMQKLAGWKTLPALDEDLFMLGLDSLHVARMVRALKQLFIRQKVPDLQSKISAQMIYNNPTITTLSQALFKLANAASGNEPTDDGASRERRLESLISEYGAFDFKPDTRSTGQHGSSSALKMILTGSTGSLGSYLLSTFLSNSSVACIYCLNRAEDAGKRQLDIMAAQELDTPSGFDDRVQFFQTSSLSAPNLGLSDENYSSLKHAGITHIIHNAWPVNFNLSLTSFTSHVAGVRALIDFCATSIEKPHLFFVSSLSSVTSLSQRSRVPETIVFDASAPSRMGYGESKYAAERILHDATTQSTGAIASTVLRVGQIAGPVGTSQGVWPMREWLPSLVISSKYVGALPQTLGRMEKVDWVPVDVLADVIEELVRVDLEDGKTKAETDVYHLINPKAISWHDDLLPTVQKQIQVDLTLPLDDWIERVRNGPEAADATRPNPAKKILGFYEALVVQRRAMLNGDQKGEKGLERYETVKIEQRSKIFRDMGPVRKEWMEKWTAKWIKS